MKNIIGHDVAEIEQIKIENTQIESKYDSIGRECREIEKE